MDDRRTVVVRGLPGQVMRSQLSIILRPVLGRIGDRFNRFAAKLAAAAVIVLKTEVGASTAVHEFARAPAVMVFEAGCEPVPWRVTMSSPRCVGGWNGFYHGSQGGFEEGPKGDRCGGQWMVTEKLDGSAKVAGLLVKAVARSCCDARRQVVAGKPTMASTSGRSWRSRASTRDGTSTCGSPGGSRKRGRPPGRSSRRRPWRVARGPQREQDACR